MELVISVRILLKNAWIFFVSSFLSLTLGLIGISERLLKIPFPDIILIAVGVFLFLFAVTREYHRLRMQYIEITDRDKDDEMQWIERYYKKNRLYPTLDSSLSGFVAGYGGGPISESLKLKNASMQSLRKLTWGNRRKLIGLILFLGDNPKDYLSRAAKYAPPGGNASELEKELFAYFGLD